MIGRLQNQADFVARRTVTYRKVLFERHPLLRGDSEFREKVECERVSG